MLLIAPIQTVEMEKIDFKRFADLYKKRKAFSTFVF